MEAVLPQVLAHSAMLVLDADGLNAIARRPDLQTLLARRGGAEAEAEAGAAHEKEQPPRPTTVLTPHPLEAARLLGCSTARVQADRLAAAQALADRYNAVVVLKGSGSVVAAPGNPPLLNGTGNALLATGGTGDVLAGLIGARLAGPAAARATLPDPASDAAMQAAFEATALAVAEHGALADQWLAGQALTAGALALQIRQSPSAPPSPRKWG